MAARLGHIFRHPVKGIGSEMLERASLSPDGALEGDRAWALLAADARDVDDWQPRRNFLQVAAGPALACIRARTEANGICLTHPDRENFFLRDCQDGGALGVWLGDLWPAERAGPARLLRAPGHGMTDMPDPFVSVGNLASLRALSQRAGRDLDMRRFRINLWLDGLAPWEEFDWIDREIALGPVRLRGVEPIGRCRATEANPESGRRDVDTLRHLREGWDHTDFGIYMTVLQGGEVSVGSAVTPS